MNKEQQIKQPEGAGPQPPLNPIEMMLRDKRIMDSYIRGEITEEDLAKKGIKLGK